MKSTNRVFVVIVLLFFFGIGIPLQGLAESVGRENFGQELSDTVVEQLSPEEKAWFLKFQEGTIFAQGWERITADILAKTPEKLQGKQRLALKTLGVKIGCEWSKDNSIRKIDNAMLKEWGALLKDTAGKEPHQVYDVLADIDQEVDMLLY